MNKPNSHHIFSAAQMAGFLDVPQLKDGINEDLQWMYDNNISYTKNMADGTSVKILWRYSLGTPTWRAGWCTSVDYSTVVIGTAFIWIWKYFYLLTFRNTKFILTVLC